MKAKNFRHPMRTLDRAWFLSSPNRRLDSNFGNLSMLIGLMIPSASIIFYGPSPKSSINEMPELLQLLMCFCIFGGCSIKLHGAMAGRRYWFPNMKLKTCYQFGYTGAPAATVGCLTYGWFIASGNDHFWSAVSAIATPFFGLGISAQAIMYWLEVRRIQKNEEALNYIHRRREELE